MVKGTKGMEGPAIAVHVQPGHREDVALAEILWGMEEEGVPWVIKERESADVKALGYEAAQASRLGVGLGVSREGEVTLHFHRLPPERPLFEVRAGKKQPDLYRRLGSNAARLVKGIPFKPLEPEARAGEPVQATDQEFAELVREITRMVVRILEEYRTGLPGGEA